ncbi:MAG: methionyl-tRNA formyltransferase [Gammaproteobacteria bacterium]
MSAHLRLGFAGTPPFAATILQALIDSPHPLELVLTQPNRPAGRGRKPKPSPVKALALAHGLPVRDPPGLKRFSLEAFALDLLVVAAYGLILPGHILAAPRLGCLNVHASLLPRWRGAAPVERAIIAGDAETGVCLMQMDAGLDTGPVYALARTAIGPTETGGTLEARLADLGAQLLVDSLPDLETMTPTPQPEEGVTYAAKLTVADARIDWADPADLTARRIRAVADRLPVTLFTRAEDGALIRMRLLAAAAEARAASAEPGTILATDPEHRDAIRVACGSGALRITRLQLNRGKGTPLTAVAAMNGYPELFRPGRRLETSGG